MQFTVMTGSTSSFQANTYFFIYEGGTLKQKVQLHTSCSAPLIRGETFGGIRLDDYANTGSSGGGSTTGGTTGGTTPAGTTRRTTTGGTTGGTTTGGTTGGTTTGGTTGGTTTGGTTGGTT